AGLLIVLVPLGLGVGALGDLLVAHRQAVITFTAILLIVLGVLQIFGIGFDVSKALPGADALKQKAARGVGYGKSLLMGAAGGIAGFCAGPILGAILTLSFGSGNLTFAGTLMAFYGLGMVVPLVLISLLWNALGDKGRKVLRGRAFKIGRFHFHTTSVISGIVIILLGVLFYVTDGLLNAPSLLPIEAQEEAQLAFSGLSGPVFNVLLVAALVVIVVGGAIFALKSRSKRKNREHSE
ncbi:MAG: cytochrome c biogenesis CcdA family protein, partial [Microbacteriaceae bacterium]|nr:cytochrome c biogenesis CcdA family protein [Microbacteriaceae bacterium]